MTQTRLAYSFALSFVAISSLAACAHDRYSAVATPASADRLHDDLKSCQLRFLFSPINGAVVMTRAAGSNTPQTEPSDAKPMIENCMRQKGYDPDLQNIL
jgi:hypothetical protein